MSGSRSATELAFPHPLIGTTVTVRANAKPAGWGDEPFDELVQNGWGVVTDVATSEDGHPFGTVEVLGWYWDWADISNLG